MLRAFFGVVFFGFLLLSATQVSAGDPTPAVLALEGTWAGQAGSSESRAVFHLSKTADGFTGTMDIPDQGAHGVACDQVLFREGNVQISVTKFAARFTGQLSADRKQIAGSWHQGGQQFPLTLARMETKLIPRATLIAYWILLILLSAFFLRMASGLCRTYIPSWRRSVISALLVTFLAYLTMDFTAYVIMQSMQGVVLQVPPWYSYKFWFHEPTALKWMIISRAGYVRYLPFVFALCTAGTLQVIILEAQVTFRYGLLIVLMQWAATVVAGYVMSLLFGIALDAVGSATFAAPVAHVPPEHVQQRPRNTAPGTDKNQKTGKLPDGAAKPGPGQETEITALHMIQHELKEGTQVSADYAQKAWENLKTYADSYLEQLKEETAPVTKQLPEPVQDFLEKGGWWIILGILGAVALLWLRSLLGKLRSAFPSRRGKKKRTAKILRNQLKENLRNLGECYTDEGPQRLMAKDMACRLRLVVLALGARKGAGLSEDMADRVLDWIKSGLAEVTANDFPRVTVWPPFYSADGFGKAFAANVVIPEQKGKKSRWVLVTGHVNMGGTIIHVGLGLYADQATTLRSLKVQDEHWSSVLGVKDERQPAGAAGASERHIDWK